MADDPVGDAEDLAMRREVLVAAVAASEGWRTVAEIVATSASRAQAAERLPERLQLSAVGAQVVLDQQVASWTEDKVSPLRRRLAGLPESAADDGARTRP